MSEPPRRSRKSLSRRATLLSSLSIARGQRHSQESKSCDLRHDLTSIRRKVFGSWLNVLLLFLPIGVASFVLEWSPIATFFSNFLAMIPIASILGDSTECLAEHLGDTLGGLINATFGNAVEVVIMIFALFAAKNADDQERETLLTVVQTSLIGSIFSNSLLVLGCCFIANGVKYQECTFNLIAAESNVELLLLAAVVMLLPGPYSQQGGTSSAASLMVSRAAALILLALYVCLLVFVLKTHTTVVQTQRNSDARAEQVKQVRNKNENEANRVLLEDDFESHPENQSLFDHDQSDSVGVEVEIESAEEHENEDEDGLELSLVGSVLLLLFTTVLVAVLSELLVDSIEPMATALNMGPAFIGIILLPIIGNAVEHMTAVRMALEDKMDVAISIAIGSATQVAMFVVSLAILIAWLMDLELDLAFNPFEVNLFLFSSIIIFALISDGKSNWLEGAMLLGLYLLIGIAVWPQEYST